MNCSSTVAASSAIAMLRLQVRRMARLSTRVAMFVLRYAARSQDAGDSDFEMADRQIRRYVPRCTCDFDGNR